MYNIPSTDAALNRIGSFNRSYSASGIHAADGLAKSTHADPTIIPDAAGNSYTPGGGIAAVQLQLYTERSERRKLEEEVTRLQCSLSEVKGLQATLEATLRNARKESAEMEQLFLEQRRRNVDLESSHRKSEVLEAELIAVRQQLQECRQQLIQKEREVFDTELNRSAEESIARSRVRSSAQQELHTMRVLCDMEILEAERRIQFVGDASVATAQLYSRLLKSAASVATATYRSASAVEETSNGLRSAQHTVARLTDAKRQQEVHSSRTIGELRAALAQSDERCADAITALQKERDECYKLRRELADARRGRDELQRAASRERSYVTGTTVDHHHGHREVSPPRNMTSSRYHTTRPDEASSSLYQPINPSFLSPNGKDREVVGSHDAMEVSSLRRRLLELSDELEVLRAREVELLEKCDKQALSLTDAHEEINSLRTKASLLEADAVIKRGDMPSSSAAPHRDSRSSSIEDRVLAERDRLRAEVARLKADLAAALSNKTSGVITNASLTGAGNHDPSARAAELLVAELQRENQRLRDEAQRAAAARPRPPNESSADSLNAAAARLEAAHLREEVHRLGETLTKRQQQLIIMGQQITVAEREAGQYKDMVASLQQRLRITQEKADLSQSSAVDYEGIINDLRIKVRCLERDVERERDRSDTAMAGVSTDASSQTMRRRIERLIDEMSDVKAENVSLRAQLARGGDEGVNSSSYPYHSERRRSARNDSPLRSSPARRGMMEEGYHHAVDVTRRDSRRASPARYNAASPFVHGYAAQQHHQSLAASSETPIRSSYGRDDGSVFSPWKVANNKLADEIRELSHRNAYLEAVLHDQKHNQKHSSAVAASKRESPPRQHLQQRGVVPASAPRLSEPSRSVTGIVTPASHRAMTLNPAKAIRTPQATASPPRAANQQPSKGGHWVADTPIVESTPKRRALPEAHRPAL